MVTPKAPFKIGFLLSGGGRTLENIVEYLSTRPELGEVVGVVSDRKDAYGLQRAENHGIPNAVLPCRSRHVEGDSEAIFEWLERHDANIVLLGGFLRLLRVPPRWHQRVLNVHPSLIPKYSGKGFYGDRVHQAVIDANETESGCTIHFVDNIYDHGPILRQERVPVESGDTPESLAARVFEAECHAYPAALEELAGNDRGHPS